MGLLAKWRSRGWEQVGPEVYAQAAQQFGTSFITHPDVVRTTSTIADMPLIYYARYEQGALVGAIPTWGKWLAGSKRALQKAGKRRLLDTGNPELILPLSPAVEFTIRFRADLVSGLHRQNIRGLVPMAGTQLCLAKTHHNGELSKKFKYNQRRGLRQLQEAGGRVVALQQVSSADLAAIYSELFQKRWHRLPKGHASLAVMIESLRHLLFGHLLELDGKPIAVQLVFLVESRQQVSAEYINGGVDPDYRNHSPGSLLSFINTSAAEELSRQAGKPLRYSFGKADAEYKNLWCNKTTVYRL